MALAFDPTELIDTADGAAVVTVGANIGAGFLFESYASDLDIAGTNPVLVVAQSFATTASIAEGTTVDVDGTTYTVAVEKPAGNGFLELELQA